MIESLIISLILTLVFEITTSLIIGIRKRNDIITVIAVNTLTNPVVVFIANIIISLNNPVLYWIVILIMEISVVIIEGKIFEKLLIFKKKSGLKISFINNVTSYLLGVVITLIMSAFGPSIRVEAASAFYPISNDIMSKQEITYDLKMKSTNEVYEDVINGKTDIAIVTEPSDDQKKLTVDSNVDLEFKPIYKEPLIIFVNKENGADNISIEKIQDLYYNNSEWNTYQLAKNNGSQTCFESIVKNNQLGDKHYEIDTMQKIIDDVALDKNGIGYAFYSYYEKMHTNENIKILKVENKSFNENNYPLLFDVYIVYRKDNNNERINQIIEWVEKQNDISIIKK